MEHALIIGRDDQAAGLVEDRLWDAGYHSLIHALYAQEAWAMLPAIKPSLIVLICDAAQTISSEELYRMSNMAETPVLVATGDPEKAMACLGGTVSLSGPYPMRGMARAIVAASHAETAMAHAA